MVQHRALSRLASARGCHCALQRPKCDQANRRSLACGAIFRPSSGSGCCKAFAPPTGPAKRDRPEGGLCTRDLESDLAGFGSDSARGTFSMHQRCCLDISTSGMEAIRSTPLGRGLNFVAKMPDYDIKLVTRLEQGIVASKLILSDRNILVMYSKVMDCTQEYDWRLFYRCLVQL